MRCVDPRVGAKVGTLEFRESFFSGLICDDLPGEVPGEGGAGYASGERDGCCLYTLTRSLLEVAELALSEPEE